MTYKHFDFELDKQSLVTLYQSLKDSLTPLDLSKSFKRHGFVYDCATNPNWLNISEKSHDYVKQIINLLKLDNIDYTMSLSELPPDYHLGPHRDIGRKSVLIIPIIGYEGAVFFDSGPVYYNDQCLLIDSTIMHWVKTQPTARVGIQISFKKNFKTMAKHFSTVTNKL